MGSTFDIIKCFDLEPTEQIEYIQSLGLSSSNSFTETSRALAKNSFAVSGLSNMADIRTAREQVVKAMKNGQEYSKMQKLLQEELKLKSYHAELVLSQNTLNAFSYSNYKRQVENQDSYPYIYFVTILDKQTSDSCEYLASLGNVCYRIDDPLLKYIYPPGHFRCRRYAESMSEKQRVSWGYKVISASSIPIKYRNSPGFQRMPTNNFLFNVSSYPETQQKQYKEALNNNGYFEQETSEKAENWLSQYAKIAVEIKKLDAKIANKINMAFKGLSIAVPAVKNAVTSIKTEKMSGIDKTNTVGSVSETGAVVLNEALLNDEGFEELTKALKSTKWWVAGNAEETIYQLISYALFYSGKTAKQIAEAIGELKNDMFASELSKLAQKDGVTGLSESLTAYLRGQNLPKHIIDKVVKYLGVAL